MVSSNAANLAAGFAGSSAVAAAAAGACAAGACVAGASGSTLVAEEDGFELRSRLVDDSERRSLYDDVLQRLPWEEIDDEEAHDFGDSMQEQHCSFLSRRWGPQQPRQQPHRQRLFGDGSLGSDRPGAEQLFSGGVSEGSVEWYEERLLEVSLSCK
jgi:hypothetical protein